MAEQIPNNLVAPKKRLKKTKIVFLSIYILILLCYGAFIVCNIWAVNHQTEPLYFGYHIYMSADDSIQETPKGSAIFVKPTEAKNLQVGNVVAYKVDDTTAVARITDVSSSDLLATNDQGIEIITIPPSSVIGLIEQQAPMLGYVYNFLRSSLGLIVVVVLPCALFLLFQIIFLVKSIRRKSSKKANDVGTEPVKTVQTPVGEKHVPKKSVLAETPPAAMVRSQVTARPQDHTNNLDAIVDELRYKMEFQDTRSLQQQERDAFGDDPVEIVMLRHGLNTTPVNDGMIIDVDTKTVRDLRLRLRNDGSLCIMTENYQADIVCPKELV